MTGRGNPEPDFPPVVLPCNQLVFDVVLVDVDLGIAATVALGQVLEVALVGSRFPAVFVGADRLGGVTAGGRLSRLVECLSAGQTFSAVVLELDGALVKVHISAT